MVNVKIRIEESDDITLQEKYIHEEMEKNLEKLEPGLQFIEHKPRIGTGEIDTLAVDADNRPVFIEYKPPSGLDKDAIIQVMDYLSWFLRDETHFTSLRDYISGRKPDIGHISPPIRLICVVNKVDERVRNACFSIRNPVAVFSYSVFKESNGTYSVVLRKEIDTEEEVVETPKESLTKKEILQSYASLQPTYEEVEKYTKSLGNDVRENPFGDHEIQFKRRKLFMIVRFRKRKGLMLDMDAGEEVQSPRFKHWSGGESPWGYVHLNSLEELDNDVKQWIKTAYERCV